MEGFRNPEQCEQNRDVLCTSGLLGGPSYAGLMTWPDTTQTPGPDTWLNIRHPEFDTFC